MTTQHSTAQHIISAFDAESTHLRRRLQSLVNSTDPKDRVRKLAETERRLRLTEDAMDRVANMLNELRAEITLNS